MNHIYRLVWSQVRRTWLVVSELARGRGKAGRTSTQRRTRVSAWWATLPLSLPLLALAAAPTNIAAPGSAGPAATIVAVRPAIVPVASTAHPTGGQVTAGSGRIDYGDHLTTIQQNSQNLSLNWLSFNIGAQDTVNFLQPNAQAIAVNRIADPNGSVILGHLNANGQVFLINPNGVLFGKGAQVNVGGLVASTLDVSDSELGRGTLHFGGAGRGSVTNLGTLTAAPGGYVALLGHTVSNQGAIHAPAGSVALAGGSAVTLNFDGNRLLDMQIDASTLNTLAENKQLIVADGGQVLMSAGAKDSLLASVVNNTGTIQARTVENRAGKIVLLGGMEAGTTHVAGTLDASAPDGGDGGFIETSAAHVQVADGAKISTLAATGNSGTWLIDPTDFTIAASGGDITGATLSSQLGGGNVTIESSQGANASGSGDIHVNDALTWSANTLTLTAAHDIDISAVMSAAGSAGLALNPATANGTDAAVAGGTINVMPGQGGRVDFTGSSNTLSINNQSYTIITALGVAGSTTGTDLQGISANLGGHYALGANIDANATASWNGNAGFAPLGDYGTNFTGVFDGLGHTISGLTIYRRSTNYIGLFGNTTGSAIRNVGLLGGSVAGNGYVGALVGNSSESAITQAYATGAVSGNNFIGGLVGYLDTTSTITHSHATGAIRGQNSVGGLVGQASSNSKITQIYATGTVTITADSPNGMAGGLVGNSGATITQAYATGAIIGGTGNFGNGTGGLVGFNGGTIEQAYATGAVSGGNAIGGLVGNNYAGTIKQAYATGAVSGRTSIGGLVGSSSYGNTTDSYWDMGATGQTTSSGGTGLTTAQLQQLSTFAGWDISATGGDSTAWRIYEGHTAPLLRSFLTTYAVIAQPDFDGSGAALANVANVTVPTDSKILGSVTGGDTLTLAGLTVGGGYTASSNADLSGLYSTQQGYDLITSASRTISTPGSAAGEVRLANGANWNSGTLAIATAGNINIAGALNGDTLHLNSGSAITDTNALNVASFVLGGGNWQQLGVTLPAFSATDFSLAGGSFVRALGGDGSSGNPYQLTDVYGLQGMGTLLANSFTLGNNIDASGTTGWNAGAGFAPIGTDSTTQFTGIFDGLGHTISDLTINRPTQDNVGLFGFVSGTVLRNIGLVGGSVSGANSVGSLVGHRGGSGSISNAYATGNVSGNNSVGGLVGALGGGSLSQSYATGNVSGVAAGSSYIGGLAGYLDGGGNISSLLNVSDVYATGNVSAGVSGSYTAGDYIGGLAGFNSANISNAYATGNISLNGNSSSYVGGLVGYNSHTLEHVHATGNISLNYGKYVGGLAGMNAFPYGRITFAYATGNITAGTVVDGGGAQYIGGLVGQNNRILDRVYATGNLEAPGWSMLIYAGGLVGRNGENGTQGTITNAYTTGNVDGGQGDYLGGLAGQNYGHGGTSYITDAYSTGRVIGAGYNVGGSVGRNDWILQGVYWNTETAGQSSAGSYVTAGVAGLTSAQMLQAGSFGFSPATTGGTGAVWRIYEGHTTPLLSVFLTPHTINAQPDFDGSGAALANIASVTVITAPTADPKILGSWTPGPPQTTLTLRGLAAGGGYTATSNVDLSGLYSTQQGYDLIDTVSRTISTPGSATGEVRLDNGASWNSGTLTITTGGSINIAGALNGDALRLNSGGAITDTNALNVASFVLGGGNWQQLGSLPAFSATNFSLAGGSFVRALGGDGTSGNPWQLTDLYGLQGVGTLLGDSFTLSNDIDASATSGWNGGAGFAPIGNNTTAFTGIFDGLGHTIGNLTINRPGTDYVGLFGFVDNGSAIRNLGVLGGSVTGHNYVGGLAGQNSGTISQTYATGAVSGNDNVGGLAGQNNGTISQTYATGAVNGTGSNIGGLVGFNFDSGTINQSYATGAVTGGPNYTIYTGGLVGFNNGAISQAYATGAVSGSNDVGGLAGFNFTNGTISQAYATGAVSGSSNVGGLAGFDGGAITDSYWDTETSNQIISAGGTGLTSAQMMNPASFAAWGADISAVGGSTAVWRIYAGYTGPLLRAFMTDLAVTTADVGTTYNGTAFAGSSDFTFGTLSPGYWLPSTSVDSSLILGNANASTPAVNAGSYTLDGGLYSGQMGYDIDLTAGTLTIGQAALTISSSNVGKTYDGGLSAAGVAVVSSGTLFGSDTLSGGSFAFTDKNAGTGKRVTVAGVSVSDGNSGGNYAVTYADNTTSTITALGVTVNATGTNKVYDGSTVDAVSLASSGILAGDTISFSGTGAFGDKHVGTAKTVGVSGIAASGADANNYSFNTTAATTADITALGVTVDATGTNRVYDGSTADTVALASAGVLSGDVVNFSGTGNFADKNVGTAKTVGVSGIAASGADANNYSFNTTNATTADITALGITVDATGTNRVYDGSTADAVALASAGVLSGDVVNFSGTGSFADKNVGTAKTVGVSGIAASGADANNYSFNATTATTADITTLGITVDATGTNRVYDGSTADAVALASAGVLSGDTVNFTGIGNFADKHVGIAKTVGVSGIAASGADANNYSFNATAATTADITALGVTVDATGTNRVYDGTTADAVALASAGVLSGDTVNFTGTGSFADKNVGTTKAVGVSGIAASGSDANNYSFNNTATTTANITAKTITVGATGVDKVYDGSTAAAITALGTTGLVAGDVVTFGNTSAAFDNKHAGTGKTVTVSGIAATGADANNYSFNTTANTTADISQLGITVDATGTNKIYDGTTADAVALASAGVLSGDTVNFTGTGSFIDKNAGTGKTVNVSGISAGGADAGDYSFNATANTTADISQLGITVDATGTNKIYDGSTVDAVALVSAGVLSGDTVNFTGTGSFADKNVGTTKAVGVSGIAASGSDANNYSFNTTATTTANITAKTITINATGVDKVYDGSTATTITALGTTGLVAGDVVTFGNTSAAFDNKHAGTGKTVTVSGIAATGTDAGNYSFNTTANTTADISQLGITVDATGSNKVYDGSMADAVALASTGVLSGDTVNFAGTGAFADKNVGTGKTVSVSGIAASGSDAGNYSFNTIANTTADIGQLGITVDATGTNRVYDGSTVDAVALTSAGVLSGDTVNFTGTGSFADKNVGVAKAVGVSGIAASGTDASNYSFNTTANTTADISQLGITVDVTGANKVYDGSTADAVALASTGVLSGDTVNFMGTGSFADKNVGTGKTVSVSGITASGADAGNYSFNTIATDTADITPRGITVDVAANDKVYDATTKATIALGSSGVLAGDVVHFDGIGRFADKNAGSGKTVTVNDIAASGADAGNYHYNASAGTTAAITPATLTYLANPALLQRGQTPGPLSGTVSGLAGGDTLAEATDGTPAWQTPATATSPTGAYAIDGSGLSALNYVFVQAPGNATALRVIDGHAPRVVASAVAGLQQSSDNNDKARAPYAPDVHIVNGGVRLP